MESAVFNRSTTGRFSHIRTPTSSTASGPGDSIDTPLLRKNGLVAVPSAGSIVPGWLLVIPEEDACNSARLVASRRLDLENFLQELIALGIEAFGGPVCVWETGAASFEDSAGCGAEQAHVHVLFGSISGSVLADQVTSQFNIQFCSSPTLPVHLSELRQNRYVWIGSGSEYVFATPVGDLQSQSIRSAVACCLHSPSYRWQEIDIDHENARMTHQIWRTGLGRV